MTRISNSSANTICTRHRTWMLPLGLLLFIPAVSGSSSPLPEIKKVSTSDTSPRNYCLGDVASLGTGLVEAPVLSGTKSQSHNRRPWTGWIRASASGKYEFSLPDSGARIFVNRQQIFARSGVSTKPVVIPIELSTNRFYAITIETPNTRHSTLPLQWRRPDGRREIIPKAYLYAPVATVSHIEPNRH